MVQTVSKARPEECGYTYIGDAGPVTLEDVVGFLRLDEPVTERWLRRQAGTGYLYRDETGAYATSCPWPRAGF